MTLLRWIALAAAFCACAAAQTAQGEAGVASPAAQVSRQLVEQKEALLRRAVYDSPAVRRIEMSNNAAAKKYLSDAQRNYRKAALSIKHDDIAGANIQLNDATWLIGKARQLVPDEHTQNVEQRERYAQMLKSVESLRLSYQGHLQRARGRPVVSDVQFIKAAQFIDAAKSLANAEQLAQANKALSDAEQALLAGFRRALGKTIEYAQRFETQAEEYAYELERNRSYADLVPIALAKFKPDNEALREVQHSVKTNHRLRDQAQRHAARKEHRFALEALRSGTTRLQNALAVAGLRVPQDPKL